MSNYLKSKRLYKEVYNKKYLFKIIKKQKHKIKNQKNTLIKNYTKKKQKEINIKDTAAIEYLDILKNECENERNKKTSFENRSGLIMALLGAICIFLIIKYI
ncbi:MAG: hypothetical protein AB9835_09195 [Eubacteriales bacterium]